MLKDLQLDIWNIYCFFIFINNWPTSLPPPISMYLWKKKHNN